MFLTEDNRYDDAADTLGGRIVCAREILGLSTSQLARRLGIKTATLSGWENDRAEPRSNRLTTLAGMLNVSPTWLLTGVGESPSGGLTRSDIVQMRATVQRLRDQLAGIGDELDDLDRRLASWESFNG